MKKNPRLEARRKNISKDIDIFVDKSFDMADRIHELLKKKGLEQKDLARMLGKSESEISKWLTGAHNFTLRTLALIENALQSDVCTVAGKEKSVAETKIYLFEKQTKFATKGSVNSVNVSGNFDLTESSFYNITEAYA